MRKLVKKLFAIARIQFFIYWIILTGIFLEYAARHIHSDTAMAGALPAWRIFAPVLLFSICIMGFLYAWSFLGNAILFRNPYFFSDKLFCIETNGKRKFFDSRRKRWFFSCLRELFPGNSKAYSDKENKLKKELFANNADCKVFVLEDANWMLWFETLADGRALIHSIFLNRQNVVKSASPIAMDIHIAKESLLHIQMLNNPRADVEDAFLPAKHHTQIHPSPNDK